MEVFSSVADIPEGFGPTAVTLGNFDGVHRGHRAVLGRLAELAAARGLRSLAVTFDPHPAAVHRPGEAPEIICPQAEKITRMATTGIDALLIQHYSLEFARQSPADFVLDYLVTGLRARLIAVGADVRFGRDNAGTIDTLRELGGAHGFEVVTIDEVGDGQRFSSTRIRGLVQAGEVADAARELGQPHTLEGTVVHGDARGRLMGFPTANLSAEHEGVIPADGVYAGWVAFSTEPGRFPAAISIGTNPTFDGCERRVEAHVVGVEFPDLDVYGAHMSIEFVARIRGQVAFEGMDALMEQMHRDLDDVRAVLG
ncbi:bifunctional riboflavin kinase/FAD synthetase [Brevibacterium sp. BRM-1]|uniref:bifunctional riboflavin kinase/FAD synthetase n=1 Tax=Brevibacterium sp. BRM-1 TaxID=2999062 RepID=UPI00227DC39A|nr:bifunctional riboflavin kinase/FAD synthetase [Brevibacterium sp. BRM-1]WAL41244.1 bifunctional riboflavin kinase/FAD synthetase [Brevibacterium sp. BRM-1]